MSSESDWFIISGSVYFLVQSVHLAMLFSEKNKREKNEYWLFVCLCDIFSCKSALIYLNLSLLGVCSYFHAPYRGLPSLKRAHSLTPLTEPYKSTLQPWLCMGKTWVMRDSELSYQTRKNWVCALTRAGSVRRILNSVHSWWMLKRSFEMFTYDSVSLQWELLMHWGVGRRASLMKRLALCGILIPLSPCVTGPIWLSSSHMLSQMECMLRSYLTNTWSEILFTSPGFRSWLAVLELWSSDYLTMHYLVSWSGPCPVVSHYSMNIICTTGRPHLTL